MHRVIVTALREWSYLNLLPALYDIPHERVKNPLNINTANIKLVLVCEPNEENYLKFYKKYKGKFSFIALQQGMYYTETKRDTSTFACDKIMCWGEQTRSSWVDCCGLKKEKTILTGCPKHDIMFNSKTEESENKIVLLSGSNGHNKEFNNIDTSQYKVIGHPNRNEYKLNNNTFEDIRTAKEVMFTDAGPGIWAMIMKKKCVILGDYLRYKFHNEPWFVEWSVMDGNSSERVNKVIKEYL